jgi:hypothetical protein
MKIKEIDKVNSFLAIHDMLKKKEIHKVSLEAKPWLLSFNYEILDINPYRRSKFPNRFAIIVTISFFEGF